MCVLCSTVRVIGLRGDLLLTLLIVAPVTIVNDYHVCEEIDMCGQKSLTKIDRTLGIHQRVYYTFTL